MAPIMEGEMGLLPKFWAEEEPVRGDTEPATGCCKAAIWPALEYIEAMEVGEADMNCEAAMGEAP